MAYRFSHRLYRLPLRVPLRTAHGLWGEREGMLLRLETDAGRVGFGEVAPIAWFGSETLAEADELCRKFGDRLDEQTIAALDPRFGAVRFALSVARSPAEDSRTGTRVPLTGLLPAGAAARAVLAERIEAGWLTFKWKVGVFPVDEELGILDHLLEALPSYAKLRLDANGAWDRRQAGRWLARCAERPIEWVEQPVNPVDRAALLGLAADYPVKLALDESVVRLEDAQRWQAEGWPGVFVIKPALAGSWDDVVQWAVSTKADIVLSSAIETALARRAILGRALREPALLKRAPGFGTGEVFGDRRWDGPMLGAVLDDAWVNAINPEELWNALS